MPRHDLQRHHRRSIRLQGYDYTRPGAYFITICTHQRAHLFGKVVNGVMHLNALGEIVRTEWFRSAATRAINAHRNTPGARVWQRNYHDRIIRNDAMLRAIRQYIRNNPKRWYEDRFRTPR